MGLALLLPRPSRAQAPAWVQQERQSRLRQEAPIEVDGRPRGTRVVDWSSGYIQVTTRATADPGMCVNIFQCRSLAERAARTLAYAELARIVEGVNVDAMTVLREEIVKVSAVRTFVRGFIRGARTIGPTKFEEIPGTKDVQAEVTMGLLIQGGLSRGILQMEYEKAPPPPQQVYQPKSFTVELPPPPAPLAAPPPPPPAPKAEEPSQPAPAAPQAAAPGSPAVTPPPPQPESPPPGVYSGLIVDATGLGAEPATVAKLRTPDLKILYGPSLVDREVALNFGLSGYAESPEDAQRDHQSRIGPSPLLVKGIKTYGDRHADIVVSEEDSQKVALADLKGKFLRKAKIVIVIK
ncbi:MAG: hypothetical protein HYY21_03665 [Candidatus Tectomicrobia bacterium]|nr:hypothetical protein [Candidatus Tectomicrobia bacterium]